MKKQQPFAVLSLFLVFAVVFTSGKNEALAQISLGGHAGFNASRTFSNFSAGIRSERFLTDKKAVSVELNYFAPDDLPYEVSLVRVHPVIPNNDTVVRSRLWLAGYQFQIGYHWYFSGKQASKFCLYLPAALGINAFPLKEAIDAEYDRSQYRPPDEWDGEQYKTTLFGLSLQAGIGLNIPVGEDQRLYTEITYSHIPYSLSTHYHTVFMPRYLGVKAGYRFAFD